jgi:hypothetical protein
LNICCRSGCCHLGDISAGGATGWEEHAEVIFKLGKVAIKVHAFILGANKRQPGRL